MWLILILISSLAYGQCYEGFENHTCCPSGYSQINCSDWFQPSHGTSDYHNTCNWSLTQPHSGNGFAGVFAYDYEYNILFEWWQYREYIAKCFSTLKNGAAQLSMFVKFDYATNYVTPCNSQAYLTPMRLTVFGNKNCIPFTPAYGCPSDVDSTWQIIGEAVLSMNRNWEQVLINVNYDSTMSIMIGGSCELDSTYIRDYTDCLPYFMIDDISLCGCTTNSECDDNSNCTIDRCINNECVNMNAYLNGSPLTFEDWERNCCRCQGR